jgi:hypothetical protein
MSKDDEKKGKLFFGGVPTAPDVNRLLKEYPGDVLVTGTVIPYEDIAAVINVQVEANRFKSVTGAWRKALENDFNIILKAGSPPGSFVVLSNGEKVDYSRGKLRSAVRASRRSLKISATVDLSQLDACERKEHDFNVNKAGSLIAAGQIKGQKSLPSMKRSLKE